MELRKVNIIRYITPLREGGSLPAICEADDGFLYVIKFRGAGQGSKALIADLVGSEIARAIGLKVPELVIAYLDESFGRTEPDEEIQDLLKASEGRNLGVHYLSGSITFDIAVNKIPAALASSIVWMDAFLMNVDRTVKNSNMLVWNKETWLIDFGASLYFHHGSDDWQANAQKPFMQIKDHVLLPFARGIEQVDEQLKKMLPEQKIKEIVAAIPEEWLQAPGQRDMYALFLSTRLHHSSLFVKEIIHANAAAA